MNFKASVALDNDAVFLNFDEFGELAEVNGKPAVVIIDEDELEKRNLAKTSVASDVEGLSLSEVLFYISARHFDHRPQTFKRMDFNGKRYMIDAVYEQMGILTIMLSRYTG
ncbi:hypothetical protein [Sporosarcina sp. P33]|uniref:hypothetical protein n=1 Tax=Sporosarcina sp. P33 TaxID=1930764 RepID=UPI0009BC9744|nr:hypothetical protein [Sporosarcina sp. P33]ARD47579.1 hypothetical protein SporoP33_04550 [Sporosarcina sp. P33]